jgi:hypothetical protein
LRIPSRPFFPSFGLDCSDWIRRRRVYTQGERAVGTTGDVQQIQLFGIGMQLRLVLVGDVLMESVVRVRVEGTQMAEEHVREEMLQKC